MTHDIVGAYRIAELDDSVFDELRDLRDERGEGYTIESGFIRDRGIRLKKAKMIIKALRKQHIHRYCSWTVSSGPVAPDHTQLKNVSNWHADDRSGVWVASDRLPTELLCVELQDGDLSCQASDLRAKLTTLEPANRAAINDDTRLMSLPGFSIVPIDTSTLYYLNTEAMHRGATNTSQENIDRTFIGMY